MGKINIKLQPATHKGQSIIQVIFPYNKEIVESLKQIPGRKYSATLKSWYFVKKDFTLSTFFHQMKGLAFIDYEAVKQKRHFNDHIDAQKATKNDKGNIPLNKTQSLIVNYIRCRIKEGRINRS